MTLCVFVLIASEFMPVSLLTPITRDLGVTEGLAGQGIAISGALAVLTSLTLSTLAGKMNRKFLQLGMTVLMAVSGLIIALASSYLMYMVGRAMIGVAIGGFWSMSAATAIRLVPQHQVTRALAIFNAGNALATVVAAPLGSYLGATVGWRGAFLCLVPIAVVAFIWQCISLPSMDANKSHTSCGAVFRLFSRRMVVVGMIACGLFFMGQFALFTYVRPFLESVTRVNSLGLSSILLIIGVAVSLLLGLWGMLATAAPTGWWTWIARTLPDNAEAGGGLMVAVIQLAIALGSTAGGIVFDRLGWQSTFAMSSVLLLCAGVLTFVTARQKAGAL